MVLKMARPGKHPTTGIYQFRKRVPEHLVSVVGKREVKISLGTRDPHEAKIAHAQIAAEIEARWRQLAVGLLTLTEKQAVAMAGEIYREYVTSYEDHANSTLDQWGRTKLMRDIYFLRPGDPAGGKMMVFAEKGSPRWEKAQRMIENVRVMRNDAQIDAYLDRHGYRLDDRSLLLLQEAVSRSLLQAREHLQKLTKGDYRPDPDADRFPVLELTSKKEQEKKLELGKYSLVQIFEDYASEKKISPRTYKRWKAIIMKIAEEVPDARNITPEWVVAYKDRLIAQGLSPKTIQEANLAALKVTCRYGMNNLRLRTNPAEGVSVAIPKRTKTREKHFLPQEAHAILKAALEPMPNRLSTTVAAAFRWVPWLCAYTGARVGEITQLRKQDIEQHGEHWLILITPEAGTVKDSQPRYVAIHPHLIEQGFLTYVASVKNNAPLFYDPDRRRGGTEGNPQYVKIAERLGAWVRKLGVDDARIRPNHAWRHLFKSNARAVKMDVGARDYMQGHSPATDGEAYGSFYPQVLAHEIEKLPRFDLT
jgi:integrase